MAFISFSKIAQPYEWLNEFMWREWADLQYCERRNFGWDPLRRVRRSWAWWTPGWGWWRCGDWWACGKTHELCNTRPKHQCVYAAVIMKAVCAHVCACLLRVSVAEDKKGTSLRNGSNLLLFDQIRDGWSRSCWDFRVFLLCCGVVIVFFLILNVHMFKMIRM